MMQDEDHIRESFAEEIRNFHRKGWSPATSTNYSFRVGENKSVMHVSRSGVDKSAFLASDFMTTDLDGNPLTPYEMVRPSAETGIHCAIYAMFPETMCIVHSHSVYSVLHSAGDAHELLFSGYEVLKGFHGIMTHETSVACIIFDNTQDIPAFADLLRASAGDLQIPAFIMRKHGTYAWGRSLFEAKRHLETLEYLLEVEWKLR